MAVCLPWSTCHQPQRWHTRTNGIHASGPITCVRDHKQNKLALKRCWGKADLSPWPSTFWFPQRVLLSMLCFAKVGKSDLPTLLLGWKLCLNYTSMCLCFSSKQQKMMTVVIALWVKVTGVVSYYPLTWLIIWHWINKRLEWPVAMKKVQGRVCAAPGVFGSVPSGYNVHSLQDGCCRAGQKYMSSVTISAPSHYVYLRCWLLLEAFGLF